MGVLATALRGRTKFAVQQFGTILSPSAFAQPAGLYRPGTAAALTNIIFRGCRSIKPALEDRHGKADFILFIYILVDNCPAAFLRDLPFLGVPKKMETPWDGMRLCL